MSMQFVAVLEPDVAVGERSEIRTDIEIGVTEIPVQNASKFVGDKFLCIGQFGKETSELIKIASVSEDDRTVTVITATIYPHYKDNAVFQFLYDKRKFYRYNATTEAWDHLSTDGSPKDISVDNPQGTYFEDTTGTESNIYRSTYLSSSEATETSVLDAMSITGGGLSTDLISLYRIRYAAGFKENYALEDSYIDEYRQDSQGEIWAALRKRYEFPLTKYSSFLKNIVKDLAVGNIWLDQYAGNKVKTDSAWKKIEAARKLLKGLADGTYILYDEDEGEDQTETGYGGGLGYFPDDNTDDTDDERLFKLADEF